MGALQSTPNEMLTDVLKQNEMEKKLVREAKKYATDTDDPMTNLPKGVFAPYLGQLRTLYLIQKYQNNLCYLPGVSLVAYEKQFERIRMNPSFNPRINSPNEMYIRQTFDSKQLAKEIRNVRRSCLDDQILVMDLTLRFKFHGVKAHAVVVLINDETFEYYDPQTTPNDNSYLTALFNRMLEQVADELQLRYISAAEVCPVGPQAIESIRKFPRKKGDPTGFCIDWSNLYIQMRLQFPEKSGREITDVFFNFVEDNGINIRDFIRGMSRRYTNYDIVFKGGEKLQFEKFEKHDYLLEYMEYVLPYAMMSGSAKIVRPLSAAVKDINT